DTKRIALRKAGIADAAQPAKEASSGRPVPTGVYVGLAATGALAIGGVVTGVMATSKRSDFNGKNDGLHVDDANSLRDQGKTLNLVADLLIGGAVVSAAITSIVYFSRPSTSAASVAVPAVALGKDGGSLVVRGTF